MNDRYLYRAKRIDNGEWIIGNLVYSENASIGYEYIIMPTQTIGNWSAVLKDTICQCTGVPDRDKKIMYENDVVRESSGVRGVIRFGRYGDEKTDYGFYVEWEKSQPYWRNDIYYWQSELRVIDNIFDNPELLEVGE